MSNSAWHMAHLWLWSQLLEPQNWQESLGKVHGKISRTGQEYPVCCHSFLSAVNEVTAENRCLWFCIGLVHMKILKSPLKVRKERRILQSCISLKWQTLNKHLGMQCEIAMYFRLVFFLSPILQGEFWNKEVVHSSKIQFLSVVPFWRIYEEVLTPQQLKGIFGLVAICLQCFMMVQWQKLVGLLVRTF